MGLLDDLKSKAGELGEKVEESLAVAKDRAADLAEAARDRRRTWTGLRRRSSRAPASGLPGWWRTCGTASTATTPRAPPTARPPEPPHRSPTRRPWRSRWARTRSTDRRTARVRRERTADLRARRARRPARPGRRGRLRGAGARGCCPPHVSDYFGGRGRLRRRLGRGHRRLVGRPLPAPGAAGPPHHRHPHDGAGHPGRDAGAGRPDGPAAGRPPRGRGGDGPGRAAAAGTLLGVSTNVGRALRHHRGRRRALVVPGLRHARPRRSPSCWSAGPSSTAPAPCCSPSTWSRCCPRR